jgi:hypothetical protein
VSNGVSRPQLGAPCIDRDQRCQKKKYDFRSPRTKSAPPRRGSRFKGYGSFTVQDLKIVPQVVCYRRERWLAPDGRTIVAPLPGGISDHFGPEVKRFILAEYHQGQTTVPRLVELLRMPGMDISKRQVVRILTDAAEGVCRRGR